MPSKKMPIPAEDERWRVSSLAEIRQHLSQYVGEKFGGNWTRFAHTTRLPVSTVEEWKPAKTGWPSFENLRTLATHRLSLDWLFNGQGRMETFGIEPQTTDTALLDVLRRRLQQQSGAGEILADQAFNHLLLSMSAAEILDQAAGGLWDLYSVALDDLGRWEKGERLAWQILDRLDLVDREAKAANADNVRAEIHKAMEALETYVPGWVKAREELVAALRTDLELRQQRRREAERAGMSEAALQTAFAMGPTVLWVESTVQRLLHHPPSTADDLRGALQPIADILAKLRPQAQAITPRTGEDRADPSKPN